MEDTIAAIATPVGEGGIGIIRISGEKSKDILDKIFRRPSQGELEGRKLTYGHIKDPDTGAILDEVLAVFMKGPKTYTAEDVVEINCHGGTIPLKRVLQLVLSQGARMAEPGEFTKRAFLNGRLDLSQAEAVIDVIRAKTDKSFDVAMDTLTGAVSETVGSIRKNLVDILVNLTVNIDYPDEDIEEVNYRQLSQSLNQVDDDIQLLLEGSKTGKIIREGVNIAIIGKPNVGKSSLMNNLLREARAIVTEIPGTTRDTIEEYINIKGIPVKITDTAGIRETQDIIEKIGIEKSKKSFNQADLVIFIVDITRPLDEEDRGILSRIRTENTLVIMNKQDQENRLDPEDEKQIRSEFKCMDVSMKNMKDTMRIEEEIYQMVTGGNVTVDNRNIITNARHIEALNKAHSSIGDAIGATEAGEPFEIIEIDVSSAYEYLGFITGESVNQDIIDQVFSRFCLGK